MPKRKLEYEQKQHDVLKMLDELADLYKTKCRELRIAKKELDDAQVTIEALMATRRNKSEKGVKYEKTGIVPGRDLAHANFNAHLK